MKWGAAAALAAIAVLTAPSARSAESDGSSPGLLGALHPEIAGRMMTGTVLPTRAPVPGPMVGLGLGVRAGVSYLGFYGGLSLMDYLSEGSCADSGTGCGSEHGASYGAEVGYGRTLFRLLTIRAQLGIGDYELTSHSTTTLCSSVAAPCDVSTTAQSQGARANFYLAPALLLEVSLGPVLVGLDANLFYMPSAAAPDAPAAPFTAFMAGAQLGVRL